MFTNLHKYHLHTIGSNRDSWKQRWAIINNDTFLFFRNKQVYMHKYIPYLSGVTAVLYVL